MKKRKLQRAIWLLAGGIFLRIGQKDFALGKTYVFPKKGENEEAPFQKTVAGRIRRGDEVALSSEANVRGKRVAGHIFSARLGCLGKRGIWLRKRTVGVREEKLPERLPFCDGVGCEMKKQKKKRISGCSVRHFLRRSPSDQR